MHVRNGVSTSRVQREVSVSQMATNMPLADQFVTFLFDCKLWKDDIATFE